MAECHGKTFRWERSLVVDVKLEEMSGRKVEALIGQ